MSGHGIARKKKQQVRACERCGYAFDASKSRCTSCGHFNVEGGYSPDSDGTVLLSDAAVEPSVRIQTGVWDEIWGHHLTDGGEKIAGIVNQSVTLLGGAPGAGKSTLALMLAASIGKKMKREVLYIAGEEGIGQIRSRADRLGVTHKKLIRIVPIGNVVNLSAIIEHYKPAAMIADSVPTITPAMNDAVDFANTIKRWSEELSCPSILIDHVTKEEEFAGLQQLQHAVDTTLLFTVYEDGIRELRTIKNRNGPSGVKKFFTMEESGLVEHTDEDYGQDKDDEDNEESDE